MTRKLLKKLKTRSGQKWLVIPAGSGGKQKKVSLHVQTDNAAGRVVESDGGSTIIPSSTMCKGKLLDRPALTALTDWLETPRVSVVVVEDLGRLARDLKRFESDDEYCG